MDIKEKIETLLQENRDDFAISQEFKKSINNYFQNLEKLFDQTQGKDFLVKHTRFIDSVIQAAYKVAIRKMFGIYMPFSGALPITLVALGSYGREQLAPYSDIDLMIVYEDLAGYNTQAMIEKILYILWDSGLDLGHRVHKLQELQEVAKSDITIKTALLESRFIIGSKTLWFKVENELSKIRKSSQKEFIFAKIDEAKKRREKYPISMNPNIKEGVGSLRDANLLYWIANIEYGIKSLKELQNRLFNENEYAEFRIALEWLFKVRAALHLVARKKEDHLLLQYIPDIAKKLEIKAKDERKRQQALVTKTLQAMHTIDTFVKIFIKKLIRKYLYQPSNLPLLRKGRVNKNIYLCDQKLYASYQCHKNALKNLLLILQNDSIEQFDASFLYYAKKIQPPTNLSQSNLKLIKRLYYKNNLFCSLEFLYKSNLLPIVVPPLKKVMFMPQFDGYHEYPVDLHSLYCVKALENIQDHFIKAIYESFNKDEKALVKLATLLHDSGKGRRQRHHEVGAKLLGLYAKKLGFSNELIEIGQLLIKQHTAMTDTAYNKDIYSEKVVYNFVAPLKTRKVLDMLYVLTYADVNGVGKNIYTNYHASLLKELYAASLEALGKKEILDEVSKRQKRESALKKSKEFLALPRLLQKKIFSIESNLFFIKHSIKEIIDISQHAAKTNEFTYKITNERYLQIEILRKKPIHLGYLLGKLSYMDIVSMEVVKLFDGIKYFKIEFSRKDDKNIDYIKHLIEQSFDMNLKIKLPQPTIKQDEITIECNHSKTYALMSLETLNQKGLLAYVAKVFDQYSIDIATAKINSFRKKVKDIFLIEKNGNFCHNKEAIIQKLTGAKRCVESSDI